MIPCWLWCLFSAWGGAVVGFFTAAMLAVSRREDEAERRIRHVFRPWTDDDLHPPL